MPFGAWLRRQRELRQVSLREIADVTKISLRYLEALEQDRFDILPAPVFAKGFLREYARYVGLDADEVVNSYLTAQGAQQPEDEAEEGRTRPRSGSLEWTSGLLLGLAVVVILALVALLAFYAERARDVEPSQPPPVAAPAATPPPPPPAAPPAPAALQPSAPLVVTMDFAEDCWVEAMVDGRRRLSELHVQGESVQIEADEQVVLLTLGNPGGVHLEVNGRPFELPATGGRIARDVVIDLDTVAALSSDGG